MSDDSMVDISDLAKAAVLAVLFNASAPAGMGFLQAKHGPSVMTVEDAEQLIKSGGSPDPGPVREGLRYDYLFGRPLKVNLNGNEFDPSGFDRDNGGTGTAQRLIEELRRSGQVNSGNLGDHRKGLVLERSAQLRELVDTPTTSTGVGSLHLGGADIAGPLTHHHDQEVERLLRDS